MAEDRTGDRVGPWILGERLGKGGNGDVWEATRDGALETVALKLIRARRNDREPYKRFMAEISTLRRLGLTKGVLPLIDSYIPDKPTRAERPWLAMPVAETISVVLAESSLEEVVAALTDLAETLAGLTGDHGISHRDIKPANLYHRDSEFLVGDFGLVHAPDLDELTRSNMPLGPAHYTAHEMIVDPKNAAAPPADVYSFGKTLWVLATGQRYPPDGHQPTGVRSFGIGDFRPHPKARDLDRVVEACTRIHPEDRPRMTDLAEDLRVWQRPSTASVQVDVSALRATYVQKRAPELGRREQIERWKEAACAAQRYFQEAFAPINDALRELDKNAILDGVGGDGLRPLLMGFRHSGSLETLFAAYRESVIQTSDDELRYALELGRYLELNEEGDIVVRAGFAVGHPRFGGNDFDWVSGSRTARVEGLAVSAMIDEVVAEIAVELPNALAVFVEKVGEGR